MCLFLFSLIFLFLLLFRVLIFFLEFRKKKKRAKKIFARDIKKKIMLQLDDDENIENKNDNDKKIVEVKEIKRLPEEVVNRVAAGEVHIHINIYIYK